MYDVEVAERPAWRVIGLAHRGAYDRIGPTFEAVGARLGELGLWPEARAFLGVYFDDPGQVPEDELRALAGIAVRDDLALPEGFEEAHVPAGRYAVLHHRGSYEGLGAAWHWIYRDWLRASGRQSRAGAACEVYLNGPDEVATEDLRTDICVPLA